MKQFIVVSYLIALHLFIIIALLKTDLVPQVFMKLGLQKNHEDSFIATIIGTHQQMDANIPEGASIFLGDSITMALATAAVTPYSVNYGICGLRSDQLLTNMANYQSLHRAKRLFLMIGTNDLLQNQDTDIESRYQTLISGIPAEIPVIMSSIPPLDLAINHHISTEQIQSMVSSAERVCHADARCYFVNTYQTMTEHDKPLPGVLLDDGIHLSSKGYHIWINLLKQAVINQK